MTEYMDILAAYVVGTLAGIWLFHTAVKEFILKNVLDNLINEGYLRYYVDDEGVTQLVKYHEMTAKEIEETLKQVEEMINDYEVEKEDNEKDDTP